MKILILGYGYIGSTLANKLVDNNYTVTVLDNLMYGPLHKDERIEFIYTDLRNRKVLENILEEEFDIIINTAAIVGAPAASKLKTETVEVNVGICTILNNILQHKNYKTRLIYLNSNSAYGKGNNLDENSTLNPLSHYAKTKLDGEKISLQYNNTIVFRLATVMGVSQYTKRLRLDLLANDLIINTYRNYIRDNVLVEIYDGNFNRNFCHIDDVVDGIIWAFTYKGIERIFNLGNDESNMNKLSLIRLLQEYMPRLQIEESQSTDEDIRDYTISNNRIRQAGFEATKNISITVRELITYCKYRHMFSEEIRESRNY